MGSYLREGADYMTCRECGEKFDMNDVARKEIPGGPFQPFCKRCAKKTDEVYCIMCANKFKIENTQGGYHTHMGETEYCTVCSQDCARKLAVEDATWETSRFLDSQELEPPRDYEQLEEKFKEEYTSEETEAFRDSVSKKYITLAAALHITQNYPCSAFVDTKLTTPDSSYLPIVITPRRKEATTEYVSQFNRVSFEAPTGKYTLIFEQEEQHQGFGVCLFKYEETESKELEL